MHLLCIYLCNYRLYFRN